MHLRHLIPWTDLVQCLRVDATEISLPIGKCGKIHLIDKATKIQVESRNFIKQNDICVPMCSSSTSLKMYSKNKLSEPILSTNPKSGFVHRKKKLLFINEKFVKTVLEFVAMEENKFRIIPNLKNATLPDNFNMPCSECYGYHKCNEITERCTDFLVFTLFTRYEIEKLLWFDSIGKLDIKKALTKNYGGQAVGNGYAFLIVYHLLPFYVTANAIIACGYESDEDKWGLLAPHNRFYDSLKDDCDFYTFIPTLRPYLEKDVFMKDTAKTMELLRIIFRHIYIYYYLMKKFVRGNNFEESLRYDLKIYRFFGFYGEN